ncbi:hypothetical protein ACQ4PT_020398 [Festuca glaucescens]
MAHHEERLAEKHRFTEGLPLPENVSSTPFQQKPFNDETSATFFSTSDVKHYKHSVASIALFHRDKMLFACSGTALPRGREKLRVARFVTSARLITEFNKKRTKDDNLRIQVRLPDNTITDGFLGLFDGNIAIVSALLPYVHPVNLDLSKDERDCKPIHLIAAGLEAKKDTSLMVTKVKVLSSGQKRPRRPRGPTLVSVNSLNCDITEAGLGGPVIAFSTEYEFLSGVIVSYDCENKVAGYLPTKALRRLLKHFQILRAKAISFRGYSLPSGVQCVIPLGLWVSVQRFISLGYPSPPPLVCELNGTLVNTFEEDFGRLLAWEGYPFGVAQRGHGDNVWEELPTEVVMNVSQSVVSLASFDGDVRRFACTGLLIKWPGSLETQVVVLTSASLVRTNEDKINENLTIKVFLPPEQHVEGKLELYHQNYNIAIVSVRSRLNDISPQDIFMPLTKPESPEVVVAIGRNPSKGLLMASKGRVEPPYKNCKLKCKALKLSTCQIKKAGIGGPLIDFHNGSFIGMNFYDGSKTTPFLRRSTIINVLKKVTDLPSNSGSTGPMSLMNNVANKNWWPVPEAYWYHGELDVDKSILPWGF